MNWYVVYLTINGQADSFGTTVVDPLPDRFTTRVLTDVERDMILDGTGVWDAERRSVIAR